MRGVLLFNLKSVANVAELSTWAGGGARVMMKAVTIPEEINFDHLEFSKA